MPKLRDVVHIFHLYRKDGTAVFLHPFRRNEKLFLLLEKANVSGHYGSEPRVESLTMFRNELYRIVETEVKGWVANARFVPRFVISAALFLVSYLFLSFVVRDPLPILDEVAISLGISIVIYILLGRRDQKSEMALKKRIALRSKVDAIVFTESPFVSKLETALEAKEGVAIEQLIGELNGGENTGLAGGHEEEATQIVTYLERMFYSADFKKTEKRLKRLSRTNDQRDRDSVRRWLESRKVDVPLLALYVELKKEVKTQA